MRKIIFILLFLLGVKHVALSQSVEQTVFQSLYDNIKTQSEYFSIKKELKGVYLIIDPITGEKQINYSAGIDKKINESFIKFSHEEQINILSTDEVILQSLKDTLILIDTLNYFSEGLTVINQERNQFLKIVRTKPNKVCTNCLFISSLGIRKNALMIALTNNEKKYIFTYDFDLSSSKIILQKTTIIKK